MPAVRPQEPPDALAAAVLPPSTAVAFDGLGLIFANRSTATILTLAKTGDQNRMGRALRVLGIIFCITLALSIVGFAVLAHYGNKLDAETQAYVDQTVPLIVGRWDVEEFMKRVSPEFLKVAPRPEVDRLFRVLAQRLGPMKAYKGSHGTSFMSFTIFNGKQLTGNYVADADFDKGSAAIQVRLVWHDPDWQFLAFHVNSPVLIQ